MNIKQTICFGITTKIIQKKLRLLPLALFLTMLLLGGVFQFTAKADSPDIPVVTSVEEPFSSFEAYLEFIRQALKIPGMSAAIVRDQELVWAAGFGYANLENKVAATPDTPFGLASVTKPIGAVVIMQLVEEGLVDLDASINQYGVDLGNEAITVRHLLTHTSEGIPGTEHHYNGNRYGYLGGVIEGASGQTFAALLSENILLPLGMKNTALNPFNSWGGTSHNILEDLKMGLGWGTNYQQYPDVYNRLALPYQFDEAYNIIPGMYQTYHNPAAGLLSSVTDLAKFDIALDQGLLLGDAAKNEMFSPAYSTYQNRQDLMYGLGWYVQEFDGLKLIWHCGRWPPSTSALYLKIPEKNLTFIVLANTDNLTVPFAGIGDGDVSKSALLLAFFRYFIFPEQHSITLPIINWDADQEIMVQQLTNVEDESAQEFLERELWSFRQVFASTGQTTQVEMLKRVNLRVYPHSKFRSDWMFTQIAGPTPIIPPVTPASAFVWLNRGAVLWILLVVVSIIWMAISQLHASKFTRWGKFLWLLAAVFLGPIAILIRICLNMQPIKGKPTKLYKAWGASALSITVYATAWSLAIAILISLGDESQPLATLGLTYLVPLLTGVVLVRIPLLVAQVKEKFWQITKCSLLMEIILFNLGFAVFLPLTMLLSERLLGKLPHPASLFFWPMISIVAIVAVTISTPLQYWMIRREYPLQTGLIVNKTDKVMLPNLRVTWPALLGTFTVMVSALAITVAQLG